MSQVLARLVDAQNDHDAERVAQCFAPDYRSEQPCHPGREFVGSAQVLANWTGVFAGVPDFRAEVVAGVEDGDTEWAEVHWSGHHVDGSVFAMRGVLVATTVDGLISSARLFVEPVEESGGGIDEAVEEIFVPPSD